MQLHNTLTRKKETFQPEDPKNVRMYVCGPTVYDRAHIGNARAVVVFDTLFRVLQHEYGNDHVTYVRNITDVDDKINAKAKESGLSISDITTKTTQQFHDDMAALNCQLPTIEPRATEHIGDMISMIEKLIENGHAYATEGHVLFDVASDKDYGHLSNRSLDEMIAGARVEVAPYKKNPADFVLWKPSDGAKGEPGWESPWGFGRPGWHIECSAMSTKYLKPTFDIHGGGADLQFPHHENEIAQSTCANKGSKFANYWVHNGFLTVEGEKMSKSLGNFITVHDLLDDGVKGEVIRLSLLSTHYRKPLDWSKKGLEDAKKTLDKLYSGKVVIEKYTKSPEQHEIEDNENFRKILRDEYYSKFCNYLDDDINTTAALTELLQANSILLRLTEEDHFSRDDIKLMQECFYDMWNLLGICQQDTEDWFKQPELKDDEAAKIENLITARLAARKSKNWAEADRIRDELTKMGITLKDNPDGTTSWSKS